MKCICEVCGKEFEGKRAGRVYKTCSLSCRGKLARSAVDDSFREIPVGTVWKRPSDDYMVIKTESGDIIWYHIWLMEQKLGRKLKKNERVHHDDENKLNNDLDNLILMTLSEHMSYHQSRNNNLAKWTKENGVWNKGKKGVQTAWNKGKKMGSLSEETKNKISNSMKKARKERFWSTRPTHGGGG